MYEKTVEIKAADTKKPYSFSQSVDSLSDTNCFDNSDSNATTKTTHKVVTVTTTKRSHVHISYIHTPTIAYICRL